MPASPYKCQRWERGYIFTQERTDERSQSCGSTIDLIDSFYCIVQIIPSFRAYLQRHVCIFSKKYISGMYIRTVLYRMYVHNLNNSSKSFFLWITLKTFKCLEYLHSSTAINKMFQSKDTNRSRLQKRIRESKFSGELNRSVQSRLSGPWNCQFRYWRYPFSFLQVWGRKEMVS